MLGLKEGIADQEPDKDAKLVLIPGLVISGKPIIIKPTLWLKYLVVIK